MVAHVAGVASRVIVTPIDYKDDSYAAVNPLRKVPSLALDDGSVLIDSPVISAYLASLGDTAKVMPVDDKARWQSLALEALADGITDAGVLVFVERRRDENPQSKAWIQTQTGKINAGLDAIDAQAATYGARTDIGVLAVAACVAWLEFRTIVSGIRDGRPHLSAWLDAFSANDFMVATAPPADA
jgi:glutathione S-transferase